MSSLVIHLLENLGFIVNMERSILFPSRETEFLGVLVSSIHMSFSLPDSKVVNLQNKRKRLLISKTATQSDLAHFIGCIPGSTPLQSTSTTKELLTHPESSPSSEGNSRCRGLVRPRMVGKQSTNSQHQACETPPSQYSYPVRCFRVRLGDCMQQDRDKGNLVPPRVLTSHK